MDITSCLSTLSDPTQQPKLSCLMTGHYSRNIESDVCAVMVCGVLCGAIRLPTAVKLVATIASLHIMLRSSYKDMFWGQPAQKLIFGYVIN